MKLHTARTHVRGDATACSGISLFDLFAVLTLLVGGAIYYWNVHFWSLGFIGENQWGDAEFWLNGAIHFAKGIVADSPGRGFRPGYFIITGSALAVLGNSFVAYYKLFLILLLGSTAAFYLSLRQLLGRTGALTAVSMITFSPYTAEWAATATTDATGFALHLIALSFLISSVSARFALRYLFPFGVVFSVAELTRPLMGPFLGVVVVLLLIARKLTLRQRMRKVALLLVAFAVPIVSWMVVQKLTVNEFTISQNEASAFYASSDPNIQVWNPVMYDAVSRSAQARLGKKEVSQSELNEEFRLRTIDNYFNPRNFKYHLRRAWTNLWVIADFSLSKCRHPNLELQTVFLLMFLGVAAVERLRCGHYSKALFAIALALFSIANFGHFGIFLMAAFAFVVKRTLRSGGRDLLPLILSLYWLIGQASLYFVGGTSGNPKFIQSCYVNDLGYRLDMQFFFCISVLTLFLVRTLLYSDENEVRKSNNELLSKFFSPSRTARIVVIAVFGAGALLFAVVEVCGALKVACSAQKRNSCRPIPYPAISVLNKNGDGSTTILKPISPVFLADSSTLKKDASDILVTGTCSSFIWNMPGQQRCLAFLYQQDNVVPFSMHPNRVIVEFPQHVDSRRWTDKQGAWVLRRTAEIKPQSYEPFYWSGASIRRFIPLSADGSGYDFGKAIDFPIAKYATQLAATGDIRTRQSSIEWLWDSGPHKRKRRFVWKPPTEHSRTPEELTVDLTSAQGQRTLSLSIECPGVPERSLTVGAKHLQIVCYGHDCIVSEKDVLLDREPGALIDLCLDVTDFRINSVAIRSADLPKNGLRVYELTLSAEDFKRE